MKLKARPSVLVGFVTLGLAFIGLAACDGAAEPQQGGGGEVASPSNALWWRHFRRGSGGNGGGQAGTTGAAGSPGTPAPDAGAAAGSTGNALNGAAGAAGTGSAGSGGTAGADSAGTANAGTTGTADAGTTGTAGTAGAGSSGTVAGGSGGTAGAGASAGGSGSGIAIGGGTVTGTSSGGTTGGAGAVGAVVRPSYNTGRGFFVVGNKLYDANGVEFHARGVDKLHSDVPSPGIPKTHANIERWVVDLTQPAATNLGYMQDTVANHIVPMPGSWEGTCNEDPATLSQIVDEWVAQAPSWTTMDDKIIINIANEWGPSGSTVWRDSYITAVGRMRAAGYTGTLSITSGGCGQDNADLVQYAPAVLASDPQKNLIFDQHIYGIWSDGNGMSWQIDLNTGLDALAGCGVAVIVGEFGPGRDIGPSATLMTPGEIIQAADARGIGWLAWAWDDPAYNADDTWFALSRTGDYSSTADLTIYGADVVENPLYGIKPLAVPVTTF
jgi:mannan endo-1,4-beta-mannosidase